VFQLNPFTYEILNDTARKYLEDFSDYAITQISAHIMYVTGGHPGCMASLLELYREKGYPPHRFLSYIGQEYKGIIEQEIEQVYNDIDPKLQDVMDFIGVFRYVNYTILKSLIDNGLIEGYRKASTLSDRLTTAYLLNRDGRLLRNDSYRLIGLRQQNEKSSLAQRICVEYISNTTAQMPELWVIEYLYQYLLGLAEDVHDPAQRQEAHKQFMDEKVPKILQKLIEKRNIQEEKKALEQALDKDEEFRFAVNYCLRDREYDDTVYQRFRDKVTYFFHELEGSDNV